MSTHFKSFVYSPFTTVTGKTIEVHAPITVGGEYHVEVTLLDGPTYLRVCSEDKVVEVVAEERTTK